jgi:hypothetical protein
VRYAKSFTLPEEPMAYAPSCLTLPFAGTRDMSPPRPQTSVKIGSKIITATPVFGAYWHFAAERQRIFFRRLQGSPTQVTADPILSVYKFTNAYRASDRVSQYLIRNVIYRDDLPKDETNVFFRTLLFKLFNKIETWEALEEAVGPIVWETFSYEHYNRVLSQRMKAGARIYSAAYIIPSAGSFFGHSAKHQNHLKMLAYLVKEQFPARFATTGRMAEAYALLRTIPSFGPFLAYQYAIDLNYSPLTNFSEDDFVVAGPGALDGIHKCFVGADGISAEDIIRYMWENQEVHFATHGIDFQSLWGRPLQLIDCQNLFCEISKYARVAFPEYTGVAGRTRIKQKFHAGRAAPAPWYPPKWDLNARIAERLF